MGLNDQVLMALTGLVTIASQNAEGSSLVLATARHLEDLSQTLKGQLQGGEFVGHCSVNGRALRQATAGQAASRPTKQQA